MLPTVSPHLLLLFRFGFSGLKVADADRSYNLSKGVECEGRGALSPYRTHCVFIYTIAGGITFTVMHCGTFMRTHCSRYIKHFGVSLKLCIYRPNF